MVAFYQKKFRFRNIPFSVTFKSRMSFLSILTIFLSFGAGLFAIREIKILAEGDAERYQVVRAISLVTMTITPYFTPEPWNTVAVLAGLLGLVLSFFLRPKGCL
jgi:hypothetical protein